jgi:2-polyprenyl-6-methoxyphenol hydroxylase-like FAD-dependent oxidoreductase
MKAIVGGAGIAGLALASRLAHAGWEVTVLETSAAPRDEAYMIDLFGSGHEAAARMGLISRLAPLQYRFDGIRWMTASGHSGARLSREVVERLLLGRWMTLLRSDLERAVLDSLPATVELRFGASIHEIRTPADTVQVRLESGEVIRADVLIGADGLHSRIRDLVFGEGSSWIRRLSLDAASLVIESGELNAELKNEIQFLSVPGRQVGFYPLRDGAVVVSFLRRTDLAATRGYVPAHEALTSAYGDLKWRVPLVLERAKQLSSITYEEVGQVVMARWCHGRVALLGDACQAAALLPGQGASMALAASYVLADELCRGQAVTDALARYEHRVRPQLAQLRRGSRRAGEWLVPATAAGLMARNATIRLSNRPGFARLLRPVIDAVSESLLDRNDTRVVNAGG